MSKIPRLMSRRFQGVLEAPLIVHEPDPFWALEGQLGSPEIVNHRLPALRENRSSHGVTLDISLLNGVENN